LMVKLSMDFAEYLNLELISKEMYKSLYSNFNNKNVIITGGASFIGSHLAELAVSLNSNVTVIDDFSSGKYQNLETIKDKLNVIEGNLLDPRFSSQHIINADYVFHLAAVHGGRGFIETYGREMLGNLTIDYNVFSAALNNSCEMVVHASSACAYPVNLQEEGKINNFLQEEQASMKNQKLKGEGAYADGVYGWTKLIGEYQLENFVSQGILKGRSARIFTAYGERENESHAAIALIAKALLGADPFPIWGNGQQTRNFTYVADTVLGLLLVAADKREVLFDVFNIGTNKHIKTIDFVNEIFKQINWTPKEIKFELDRPTGVARRASDNSKILDIFGWAPGIDIEIGLNRTINWYKDLKERPKTIKDLEGKLNAR